MNDSCENISKKALLVILDGFGIREDSLKNAIQQASTPKLDFLFENYPMITIEASGEKVGLPKGIAGNSEVGHMNIGAGRSVKQDLVSINESISLNNMHELDNYRAMIDSASKTSGNVHLIGLLSDGGVHSHIDHLMYIINLLAREKNINKIILHVFSDGRDTKQKSLKKYIDILFNKCQGKFILSSLCGRSIGMDRDCRWEKIEEYYNMICGLDESLIKSQNIVEQDQNYQHSDILKYIDSEYDAGRTDEFIAPKLFSRENKISSDDSVWFVNFRPDRAAQITLALTDPNFSYFKRPVKPAFFLCMVPYVQDQISLPILFEKENLKNGLSEYLSCLKLKQYKIAETEKYAHVTYFFNGGRKKAFENEKHILIPSPREVKTYDEKPEMSAFEVSQTLIKAIEENSADFYVVNFANSDMVGHTGNFEASKRAVEYLDAMISDLYDVCLKKNISMVITADHGNSDQMIYDDQKKHTSHTASKVPFCIVHDTLKNKKLKVNQYADTFALKDIAPSLLYIMGLDKSKYFEGQNIFM